MSLASQPHERADAIEVYLGHQGEGTLALAVGPPAGAGHGRRVAGAVQRVTSSVLRGGLTSWVHVGMTVRRLRGRADPLQGLGQRDTFLALCRLTQAAIEAQPLTGQVPGDLQAGNHVRLFATQLDAEATIERIQRVLGPYAAAGTVTRTGRAVIAWFAIRHLIATRSHDYSLQVVHFTLDGTLGGGYGGQVSLMLPRDPADVPFPQAQQALALASGAVPAGAQPAVRPSRRMRRAARRPAVAAPAQVDLSGLQAYLDTYREYLTRELLLEPVVEGPAAGEPSWVPEPTGDGGVAVAGTVPAAIEDHVVLRMAEHAMAQLASRSPDSAGTRLPGPEAEGDLLVQRWSVGAEAGYALSVAARSGDRRRPTQVLIHFAVAVPADAAPGTGTAGTGTAGDVTSTASEAVPPPPAHEPPKTGPDAAEASTLTTLPLWWHSADARCDGNDVILYEMPFRGQRLRVRANDYPAEPMYTLLVGDPGAEIAAVDLEHWPSSWTRPRSF